MFKENNAILKNISYLSLLGIHAFIFVYFLINIYLNYILTIISSFTMVALIILAFYSFLTNKSYYFYFYVGIIICSFPVIFRINFSAFLIVPELTILIILLLVGLDRGTSYYKMRVDKQANLFQHDPAVTNMRSGTPKNLAFKMDELWNPDSTLPMQNKNGSIVKSNSKMQIIAFLLTAVFFICSVSSVYSINLK